MSTTAEQDTATGSEEVLDRTALYINGTWGPSDGSGTIEVRNPATEEVIGIVAEGTPSDVDRAVAAAVAALPEWSGRAPADRADLLQRVHELLVEHTDEIALLMSRDIGMPLSLSGAVQLGLPTFNFGHFAELARAFEPISGEVGNSTIVREPVGVVACITPWNFPMHQVALKAAAALAAGCTVVVKPSEVAPLGIWALAELIDEAGFPPGVFNLISGLRPVVGEALVAHPGVDMVSFTGSTRAGSRIAEVAAKGIKRVALELGGKSANVILDDADLEGAIRHMFNDTYLNSGQSCAALTGLLVPAERLEEAEQVAKEVAETFTTGDPLVAGTRLGPLVSGTQRDRVMDYIRSGEAEGATLLTGGTDSGHDVGYFVPPTVFSRVTPGMTIAQEEIFGPVLSIMTYTDEDDAVTQANGTAYGLAARVWSADADRALRVARRLRAGQVSINDGAFNPAAPFGGFKHSGLGREGGTHGLDEFLEVKAIQR